MNTFFCTHSPRGLTTKKIIWRPLREGVKKYLIIADMSELSDPPPPRGCIKCIKCATFLWRFEIVKSLKFMHIHLNLDQHNFIKIHHIYVKNTSYTLMIKNGKMLEARKVPNRAKIYVKIGYSGYDSGKNFLLVIDPLKTFLRHLKKHCWIIRERISSVGDIRLEGNVSKKYGNGVHSIPTAPRSP